MKIKAKIKRAEKKGFTLIELLVVISIISLLASFVLVSVNSARKSSRDAKRHTDAGTLINAINLYKQEKGVFPGQLATEPGEDDTGINGIDVSYVGSFMPMLVRDGYMTSAALDPTNNNIYYYAYLWKNGDILNGSTLNSFCNTSVTPPYQAFLLIIPESGKAFPDLPSLFPTANVICFN